MEPYFMKLGRNINNDISKPHKVWDPNFAHFLFSIKVSSV